MTSDLELRIARYAEWLAAQGIQYGFPQEIAALARQSKLGVKNDVPPLERWHAIVPSLQIAELLRERFGPTVVTSAYRSRLYNIAVYEQMNRKPTDSRHSANDALDLQPRTGTPAEWARFLRGLRDAGRFKGGIGVYRTFVHLDTRGSNADWAA